MGESKGERERLMTSAAGNPLGVYVVIVLVVEAGLAGAVAFTDSTVQLVLVIGMVLVLALVVIQIGRSKFMAAPAGTPEEVRTIWSKEDLPIPGELARDWCGTWNCRWSYCALDGDLKPYVDDHVAVDEVNEKNGFVTARGIGSYEKGVGYKVSGRISKRGFGVFFYSSAGTKFAGLDGTFILRRNPIGDVEGWWMGNARTTGEVQGRVTFEKAMPGDGFEPKVYPVSDPGKPGS